MNIRQLLSESITEVANDVLPLAVGDAWMSEQFTVLFPSLKWVEPCPNSDDGLWSGFAVLRGDVLVRVHTDALSPIDLTPLMLALRQSPIIIEPDSSVSVGEFGVQLYFRPDEIRDLMYESGVIPIIQGYLENCYIFQRTDFVPELFEPEILDTNLTIGLG